MNSGETEIEDAPSSYKSDVWQHFGFPVTRHDDGKKITDKTQTVCKNCKTRLPYTTSKHFEYDVPFKTTSQQQTSANSCDKKGERRPNIYTTQFCCNMVSVKFVLQTRPLFESHTGTNIAEVLKAAIQEWELEKAPHSTAVVTDNARNMEVAVREAGLLPHIKCFAHTLNLASQAGLNVSRVSRLLGRVRKVVAFFHRSATATAVLTEKQKMLEIASHKLIMDVVTRWNSSMDMLECYLEQQAAITAALLSTGVRKNARQLDTMDSNDITDAEEIVNLLKPLKKSHHCPVWWKERHPVTHSALEIHDRAEHDTGRERLHNYS